MFLNPLTQEEATARLAQFKSTYPKAAAASNGRAERAVQISTTVSMIETDELPHCYLVHSESNPLGRYMVNTLAHTCTCPDSGKHAAAGVVCKHRLAVGYLTGFGASKPAPVEQPKPTLLDLAKATKKDQWFVGESVWLVGGPHTGDSAYLKNVGGIIRLYLVEPHSAPGLNIFYLTCDGWEQVAYLDDKYQAWKLTVKLQ
jgi:hypothetical protein